jgi:hypothetical protein
VMVVIRIVVEVLLLAHGLVHLLYVARDAPEFSLASSWLVPESVRRPVALALMVINVAAFVLVALALWGVPGLSRIWPALTIAAASLSLVLLVAFWANWLILGVAIDIVLIAIAAIRPGWVQHIVA